MRRLHGIDEVGLRDGVVVREDDEVEPRLSASVATSSSDGDASPLSFECT